ncbi:MAG: cyclic nucleotide-binding domain-containing protein, partial [Myxococcales bacterium]|nr:cyclic nucleotide-binding domain-containing protein [Myxococcales bacterium]
MRAACGLHAADLVTPIKSGEITSCSTCPCGQAAGVRFGGRCPLVDRKRRTDETIYLEGDLVSSVWFVKRGTVVLSRAGEDGVEHPHAVRGPGTFVGLEGLVQATYADTARTTEPSVLCGISRAAVDTWFGPRGTPARMALEVTLATSSAAAPRAGAGAGTAGPRGGRGGLARPGAGHPLARGGLA